MSSAHVLGLPMSALDGALRAATRDLVALLDPAREQGADRVEPSHVVVALSRIRGGLAETYLVERRVPVDTLAKTLARARGEPGDTIIATLDESTASEGTAAVFAALRAKADAGEAIREAEVLREALLRLEPAAADVFVRLARIDPKEWAAAVILPATSPPKVFEASGGLCLDSFSPGNRRVFETLSREAGATGSPTLGVALLLHTMAITPGGLLEQGLQFTHRDVRSIRERLFTLVGARPHSAIDPVPIENGAIEKGLDLVLTHAAALAAGRRSTVIAERDLLGSMLAMAGGLATSFFRDVDVDVSQLLRFAEYYEEPPLEEAADDKTAGVPFEDLEAHFRRRLLGQDEVVRRLLPRVQRVKLGLLLGYRRERRPAGTFLFSGPSGTGKTMTAHILAELVYGSADDVLVFDMGTFNTKESINTFIGAPPGYVGYGEGQLTNGLRDNPRRVLLFDEVEKADERVFHALMGLLDEGRVTDPAGPVRDARESLIVLTSNLGSDGPAGPRATQPSAAQALRGSYGDLLTMAGGGRESNPPAEGEAEADVGPGELDIRKKLRAVLVGFFKPEFLNRVDEVILFAPFEREQLRAIAVAGLEAQAAKAAKELGVTLTWQAEVPECVADLATKWRKPEAARGVNRTVEEIETPVLLAVYQARQAGRALTQLEVRVDGAALSIREVTG